ncbi:enoyl-CoA hydratase/isomerase family protein, partial [Acinetobacter baumannii]
MDYQNIIAEEKNGVGYLTFNRPKALNSFNVDMHREVAEVLNLWTKNPDVRCVVISGEGRGFCAGQDLGDRVVDPNAEAPDLGYSIETYYNPLIKTIVNMPKPVICAVNGVAAGAGANIALACDLVIAAKSANFVQAFCRLGLVPDSAGTWFLPRAVGHARAMGLALLGDKLPAETAKEWGMIWDVVEDAELKTKVTELAERLAKQPTFGLSLIKKAIHQSSN